MRVKERLELLDRVSSELQSRFTFADLDLFLKACGIDVSYREWGNSKRIYARDILADESEAKLLEVADELELDGPTAAPLSASPPQAWERTPAFRLFISHISKDKLIAMRLKEALATHSIAAFVAHEDIEPT